MNKKKIICILSSILMTISSVSCKKNNNSSTSTSNSITTQSTSLTSSSTTSSTSSKTSSSSTSSSSSTPIHTHTYGNWQISKEPTYTSTGTIFKRCVDNDITLSIPIPALNKTDYVFSIVKESTCSTKGTGKYVYVKDNQEIEVFADLELNPDNHVRNSTTGNCEGCGISLYLQYSFGTAASLYCSVSSASDDTITSKKVVIPSTITKDGIAYSVGTFSSVFKEDSKLLSIVMPDTIFSLSSLAFCNCTSLEYVKMSNTIVTIGPATFANCSNLKKIELSSSLQCIATNAFHTCTALESIVIPNSVTKIQDKSFAYCSSLKTVVIPPTITNIESDTFYNSSPTLYVKGSKEETSSELISKCESSLAYYSETDIKDTTLTYWHYVDDVPTKW